MIYKKLLILGATGKIGKLVLNSAILGVLRENQANPWSKVLPPENLTELVTNKMLHLVSGHEVKRLISISAAGVGDSEKILTFPMKILINFSNVKVSFMDLLNMEKAMNESNLDTLALRPIGLKDGEPTNATKIVDRCGMTPQIARSDVAIWMLDALERSDKYTNSSEIIGV